MANKLTRLAILNAAAMMVSASNFYYTPGRSRRPESESGATESSAEHHSCNNTKFVDSRQLKEFSVKAHKVMAYSRKDAITRLKHQKKL